MSIPPPPINVLKKMWADVETLFTPVAALAQPDENNNHCVQRLQFLTQTYGAERVSFYVRADFERFLLDVAVAEIRSSPCMTSDFFLRCHDRVEPGTPSGSTIASRAHLRETLLRDYINYTAVFPRIRQYAFSSGVESHLYVRPFVVDQHSCRHEFETFLRQNEGLHLNIACYRVFKYLEDAFDYV